MTIILILIFSLLGINYNSASDKEKEPVEKSHKELSETTETKLKEKLIEDIMRGNFEAVKKGIEELGYAEFDIRNPHKPKYSYSPLMTALGILLFGISLKDEELEEVADRIKIVKELVKHKADVNYSKDQRTPLDYAIAIRRLDLMEFLLKHKIETSKFREKLDVWLTKPEDSEIKEEMLALLDSYEF